MSDKVAIVTGASSGIGKAILYLLARNNWQVVLVARDKANLESVADELWKTYKVKGEYKVADVSNQSQMKAVISWVHKKHSQVNCLVNCAGYSSRKPLTELSLEEYKQEIETNLDGVFLPNKLVFKYMDRGASIVNVASIRGRTGTPSSSPGYAAAKAGVINMTKSFALQYAGRGVRVNCVAPGVIYGTGMNNSWDEQKKRTVVQDIPLGRLGTPDDVAQAVLFLVSAKASYITGQTLDINGGVWMG